MEEWRDIEQYEGEYLVSNLGRVKSLKKNIFLKTYSGKNSRYYELVRLCANRKIKTYKAHRIVAQAFIPNPLNLPQVNHINGIKNDNRVENLEWCTASQNIKHAVLNNLQLVGSLNGNAKLSDEKVKEILISPLSAKELSKKFNVTQTNIYDVIKRKIWKHVTI